MLWTQRSHAAVLVFLIGCAVPPPHSCLIRYVNYAPRPRIALTISPVYNLPLSMHLHLWRHIYPRRTLPALTISLRWLLTVLCCWYVVCGCCTLPTLTVVLGLTSPWPSAYHCALPTSVPSMPLDVATTHLLRTPSTVGEVTLGPYIMYVVQGRCMSPTLTSSSRLQFCSPYYPALMPLL